MKKTIKVNYYNGTFNGKYTAEIPAFFRFMKDCNIEISENPDFVLYREGGSKSVFNLPINVVRIFYTGENIRPNFNECDYALTHDCFYNERHFRLPESRHWIGDWALEPRNAEKLMNSKTKFCNFVYSNANAKERIDFFNLLSKYKKVDSGGKLFNNLGYFVGDKMEFLNQYKFTIAFENSSFPGYSTEKLIQPLMMGSIPIYWGDTQAANDYNPDCFINVHNYKSFDDVVKEIIRIDNDDQLWRKYIEAPVFKDNRIPDYFSNEKISQFFNSIFEKKKHQISPIKKFIKFLLYYLKVLTKNIFMRKKISL